jgi:DNA-directed RNA polymerase specialized sigma24 family protein
MCRPVLRKDVGAPLLYVTGDEEEDDAIGEDALLDLMRGGFVLGLVSQLQAAYTSAGTGQVEDAVAEAVSRLVVRLRKEPPVADVASYLAKVAHNTLKRTVERRAKQEAPLDDRPEEAAPAAEDEALRHAAVEVIRAEIRTWTNANIREVMLVYVDSIAYGEPLEAEEVAVIAGQSLDEEISAGSVRVCKARGLKRLQEFVGDAGLIETRRTDGAEEER